jgi:peptidylprolyl isomerase
MQITRKITVVCAVIAIAGFALYFYRSKSQSLSNLQPKIALLSEINGYLAWESEIKLYPMNDVEAFIKGARTRAANEKPPGQMSHDELYMLTQEIEFDAHKKKIAENLKEGEAFLAEVAKEPQVMCVVDNLLYYKVVNEGEGPVLVDMTLPYYFNYTVSLPDGTKLYDTHREGVSQKVLLNSVIPGFAKGVMGMRQGERRVLYIHPSIGFRCMHWTVPPNVVLVMDVELGAKTP